MAKRCYILGAGFSKPCDLPLARQLMAQVCQYRKVQAEELGFKPDDPQEIARQQHRFLSDLYPRFDLDYGVEESWPDFEDVITVLDEWEDFGRACASNGDQLVRSFKISLIRNLHALLCERVSEAREADGLKNVQDFVTRVHNEQSTIVSFNWDLLLEVAAQSIGLGIAYEKQSINNTICVAKPHGSLNLADVERARWEEWKNQAKKPINIFDLDVERELDDSIVVRARDPNAASNRIVGSLGPIIVPPAARKAYTSRWIAMQWHLALDMVRNADEVVIIGYSLPVTDIRPRLLIQFARFRRDKAIPITLIDPRGKGLRDHFSRIVGSPLEVICQSWESAALAP